MNQIPLYPLRFEPIYQYRLWGGRHLAHWLSKPLPDGQLIGEAWLLSDRDDYQSLVADGDLKGVGIGELMKQYPDQLLGKFSGRFTCFPLLLKFLDVHEMLSVQVHPSDAYKDLLPAGESGKTEGWVVLESSPKSRIYAGLKAGTTAENLRQAIQKGNLEDYLESFTPKPGDGVLITAGTVHALGGDVVVFEVQQNSDVTFRLFDWNHIDPKTGKPRELQVDQALACIDFEKGAVKPVASSFKGHRKAARELAIQCEYFEVWRIQAMDSFKIGQTDMPAVVVCLEGKAQLEHGDYHSSVQKGDVILLPAIAGICTCHPEETVSLLEIILPE
jgi:mannose-6-phosphate isomerase